jgi:predicted acyltransferase
MFWIMGAEETFHALFKATNAPFWGAFSNQFSHPEWNGFHVYDLIFPLFLFIPKKLLHKSFGSVVY